MFRAVRHSAAALSDVSRSLVLHNTGTSSEIVALAGVWFYTLFSSLFFSL